MRDQMMPEESNIKSTVEAVKGIAEAVPVYQDAVQPAAKEVGVALQTVAKTLHIVLAPVSTLVWGYDKLKDFVSDRVAKKLKDVPLERLTTPAPNVAGPALEALKYTGYEEELRELYANLLATAIDSKTIRKAHPSFVQIIQQLCPDEAKMIKVLSAYIKLAKIDVRKERRFDSLGDWSLIHFSLIPFDAGCAAPDLGPTYLINLARLGLVELREHYRLADKDEEGKDYDFYGPIIARPEVRRIIEEIEHDKESKGTINKGAVMLTPLGEQFCHACVRQGTHAAI